MIQGYSSLYNDYEKLLVKNEKLSKENRDLKYYKSLYEQHKSEYESLLIKNDKLSKENRDLKYLKNILEKHTQVLLRREKEAKEELLQNKNIIKEKDFEIARLKALLNMDGTNHNIPTSQTPINKKKVIPNTREKTNLPKGGQVGHKKHKLEKFKEEEITEHIEHVMEKCPCCNSKTIKETGSIKEKDELDYRIVVEKKRHRFVEYKCEKCGKIFHEEIPNSLKEENQYGPQVQALELILMNQANVTINKAQKMTKGITNGEIELSEGYIAKLQNKAANNLKEFMKDIKLEIIKQPIVYWDDTVIMVDTQRSCLRFYGTDKIAMYVAHPHKNKEGLNKDGVLNVLPKETIVEHDHNKINYGEEYKYTNAECNRHLITDLKKVIDNLNHKWAKKLIELLTKMNNKRKNLIKKGKEEFSQEELNKFEYKFEEIMIEAHEENLKEKEEGKFYAGDENTLILRILDYKNEYFLWIYNFDVPFTNNLSERSLRGVKSKQKASGQFLNIESASWYATIKTYIETCNRNGVNIYNALLMLSVGKPYSLKQILSGELTEDKEKE